METVELYIYLLIAVTFIVAFLISSMLRGGTYHKKYKQTIDKYKYRDEELTKKLDLNNQDLQNTKDQFTLIKNKLSSQNTILSEFENKKRELEIDSKNFQTSKIALQNNIKNIDLKILNISDKLKTLALEKNEILNYQEKITIQKKQADQKHIEIKNLNDKTSNLEKEKRSLAEKITIKHELNDKIDKNILNEKEKIKNIKDEFKIKIDDIEKKLSESKQKALNYQYAIEHIKEKINAYESIGANVIDKIISKNEEKGVFANLKQKLFDKSANYIKEGK